MTNKMLVNVGDVLADRDSRREGRLVKVLHVDPEFVTVETIQDSFNATASTVGRSTDVAISRLGKAYRLNTKATVEPLVGVLTPEDDSYYDYDDEETYPEDDEEYGYADDEDDEVTETNLESALNSAGFFYVPDSDIVAENLESVGALDMIDDLYELIDVVVEGIREGVFGE